ncbi:MAG: hypothetical protein ACJ76N_10515 [Thermoanaerobaculia bacterium]
MELLFGTLSIRELNSFLLIPQDLWLLMVDFPDPEQAGAAATNFISNIKHISDGTDVAVKGTRNSIDNTPVFIMSDINEAGGLMTHVLASPTIQPELNIATRPKRKKALKSPTKRMAGKKKGPQRTGARG